MVRVRFKIRSRIRVKVRNRLRSGLGLRLGYQNRGIVPNTCFLLVAYF